RGSTDPSRRDFLKQSAFGAAAGSAAGAGRLSATEEPSARKKPASKIRIGTRINSNWLSSENDNDLRFLKQIGVDYVDIELDMMQGYRETAPRRRSRSSVPDRAPDRTRPTDS